jgi:hypothetical protein
VTTIPYHCSRQEKSIWLDRGSTIRRQTGMTWIVLHHVPAKTGLAVSGEELEALELLAAYRPDYFVSGHDHAFPYTSGQSWNQKLGITTTKYLAGSTSSCSLCSLQATISRLRLVPGGGSIERQLVGICCWQNQPFRPPAMALGEKANANPWPKRPHGSARS